MPALLVVLLGCLLLGAAAGVGPYSLGLALLPLVGILVLLRVEVRVLVMVFGALIVLQSSDGVGPLKYAYGVAVLLCGVASVTRLHRARHEPLVRLMRPALQGSATLAGLLVMSLFVAVAVGVDLHDWARGCLPLLLLSVAGIVGVDAARTVPPGLLSAVLGAAGLLASIGFAVDWLDRRGVSALSVGKFTLASFSLLAAVFCYSVARAVGRGRVHRRLWWLAMAATVLVCVLVTGSRTGLVLLVGLAGFVFIKGRAIRMRAVAAGATAVVVLVVVLVPLVASVVASRAFLQGRIETATAFVRGDGKTDRSLLARQRDYGLAREALASSPVFGVSPGHLYPPAVSGLAPRRALDTPLVTVAKFGVAGMALLVVALALLYRSVAGLRRLGAGAEPRLAVRVYAFVFSIALPFGAFLEDGGFAVAVLLLVAVCGAEARAGGLPPEAAAPRPARDLQLSAQP